MWIHTRRIGLCMLWVCLALLALRSGAAWAAPAAGGAGSVATGAAVSLETGPVQGNAAALPGLWVTPLELDFGPVGVGMWSAPQVVTITNTGTGVLTHFAGGAPWDNQFWAVQNCAAGVAPGASCQYTFRFHPNAAGTFTTTSNSGTNAGPFTIRLRGTGVGPSVSVNPLSLDFGSVMIGNTSAPQVVTITNTSPTTLTNFAGGGSSNPQFHVSANCAAGVPPGGHCHYWVTFKPTAAGAANTTSHTHTNAGEFTIQLHGSGRSGMVSVGQYASPLVLDFGRVGVGMTSATQVVTITNQNWFAALTHFAGGGMAAPFYALQDCAPEVAAGGVCHFFYRFRPTAAGVFSATTSVSDSAGSFQVQLRGTGVGASLTVSPLWLDFGPVPLGLTSPVQTVTIRNTSPTTLTNFAGGGVYAPFNAQQNCAGGVPPGGSCQYFFYFSPTARGRYSASSSSGSNGGPFRVYLQGGEPWKAYLPIVLRP